MFELLFKLRRFLLLKHIDPARIKVTIEFLSPETQHIAEYELRKSEEAQKQLSPQCLMDICDGKDFKIMGIPMQVKGHKYPEQRLRLCICKHCQGH